MLVDPKEIARGKDKVVSHLSDLSCQFLKLVSTPVDRTHCEDVANVVTELSQVCRVEWHSTNYPFLKSSSKSSCFWIHMKMLKTILVYIKLSLFFNRTVKSA